ncbi:MAG: AAA family ATPase [Hyphomicrobiales bacterium]
MFEQEREKWRAAIASRHDLLKRQCEVLTQYSENTIRATLSKPTDFSEFLDILRSSLKGSGFRGEKIEAICNDIINSDEPDQRLDAVLSELEALALFEPSEDGIEARPETPSLAAIGLTANDLDRLGRSLDSENWLRLAMTEIKRVPSFEYRSGDGDYIRFEDASSGQQATALLRTLLNQAGPPLIIDQPEDDLDNPVIQDIVEQIWEAKQRRQLIFASHNANLVVNGDAELVVWCDYRRAGSQSGGKIAGQGAIDIPDVNKAIRRIMEGGNTAFNLRREKYGF